MLVFTELHQTKRSDPLLSSSRIHMCDVTVFYRTKRPDQQSNTQSFCCIHWSKLGTPSKWQTATSFIICITKKIISDQRAIYSTLEHEDSHFLKKMTQERCESIISWNDTNHFYLDSKLLSAGDNTKIIFIYHSEALLTAN